MTRNRLRKEMLCVGSVARFCAVGARRSRWGLAERRRRGGGIGASGRRWRRPVSSNQFLVACSEQRFTADAPGRNKARDDLRDPIVRKKSPLGCASRLTPSPAPAPSGLQEQARRSRQPFWHTKRTCRAHTPQKQSHNPSQKTNINGGGTQEATAASRPSGGGPGISRARPIAG